MKKVFLKKVVGGIITIATISTLIPVRANAELKQYNNGVDSDVITNKEYKDELSDYGLTVQFKKYTTKTECEIENEVVKLINNKRKERGVNPVTMDDNLLLKMARYKSDDVIQYGNDKLDLYDGSSVGGTLERLGYKCNSGYYDYKINYGIPNAEELFNSYCGVEEIRYAITNPSYTRIAIGVVYDENAKEYVGTLIVTD